MIQDYNDYTPPPNRQQIDAIRKIIDSNITEIPWEGETVHRSDMAEQIQEYINTLIMDNAKNDRR